MAKIYFEKLSAIIHSLDLEIEIAEPIDVKHFFNGAALYVNGSMCASWSPAGLAFKLEENEVARLIRAGEAKPLKYFEKGYIKKGYALFDTIHEEEISQWKPYFIKAAQQVSSEDS